MRRSKSIYAVLAIAIILSILLTAAAGSGDPLFLDQAAADLMKRLFPESSYSFFNLIAELGDKLVIGIIVLLMIAWLAVKKRDVLGIIILVTAVGLGNEVSKWIKELVARERPAIGAMEASYSFPSGHAMVGLILYVFIACFIMKNVQSTRGKWWIGSAAAILILLIGLSRIAVHAHYFTDVLGGYTFGIIWSYVWLLIYEVLKERLAK